ncbi:MAG: hypothetical protein JSV66_12850 [Trueperaceae bacterium]|nr:MAG: hypothetical protein JSV66_12850 [Trueperaceae bacterium]
MARRKQSRGTCVFCGKEMAKSGVLRHLSSCPERQRMIDAADQKQGKAQPIFQLQVRDADLPDFWLHLEMKGSATLADLDAYLRAIWLECCGHLSRFSIGGWSGEEISKETRVEEVFDLDVELTHIYDFGTSSETLIRAVGEREGMPLTKPPIFLMARNHRPEVPCMKCDQPATWLCLECVYEYERDGTLCDRHAKRHPHDDYGGLFPLVNSPRVGMCGYEGPADPPY